MKNKIYYSPQKKKKSKTLKEGSKISGQNVGANRNLQVEKQTELKVRKGSKWVRSYGHPSNTT